MTGDTKIAHKNPPLNTRFPINRQDHTQKHPNGYLTPILKKLLNKEMTIDDPEVQKVLDIKSGTKAELKKIIMLRWILNAIQGENKAIEGIIDRIDGKTSDVFIDQSKHTYLTKVKVNISDDTNIPLTQKARVNSTR